MRGGFHSENRGSAFIQQQLQQEAAVLNSDERSDKFGAAPQRRDPVTIAPPSLACRGSEFVAFVLLL